MPGTRWSSAGGDAVDRQNIAAAPSTLGMANRTHRTLFNWSRLIDKARSKAPTTRSQHRCEPQHAVEHERLTVGITPTLLSIVGRASEEKRAAGRPRIGPVPTNLPSRSEALPAPPCTRSHSSKARAGDRGTKLAFSAPQRRYRQTVLECGDGIGTHPDGITTTPGPDPGAWHRLLHSRQPVPLRSTRIPAQAAHHERSRISA